VLLGIAIGNWFVTLLPMFVGWFITFGGMKVYEKWPGRKLSVIGAAFLSLICLDTIFLNILYKIIPDTFCGVTTGKSQCSLFSVNIMLVIFAAISIGLIIKDILTQRK